MVTRQPFKGRLKWEIIYIFCITNLPSKISEKNFLVFEQLTIENDSVYDSSTQVSELKRQVQVVNCNKSLKA